MEKLTTDIYTFSRLREEVFVYVNKTDALYAMASGEAGVKRLLTILNENN